MYPIEFSYTPADDDADGFANDVTAASGVAFTLAATTPGDGLAHKVIITPSGSVTGSYVITGTDADAISQSETLLTNTTNAVTSVKYYKTLVSVTAPAGLGAETVDIGWTDVCVGPTFPLNWRQSQFQVSLGVDISGTINYTVQHCLEDVRKAAPSTLSWWPHATLVSKTADTDGNYASPVTATRLLINSLTGGATIDFQIVQGK
jgi:hypothetical protein